jgi:phage baseplate assembly protein W
MYPLHHLPLTFSDLLKKERIPVTSIKESIKELIYLMLLTQRGEWRYDPDFQCVLWEKDFEQTDNLNLWLDAVKDDIRISITRYETRLKIRMVDIQRDELPELSNENKVRRIRNRLTIKVQGTVIQTEETFDEEFLMFFGPITVI